jgi:hypothetical protein
MGPMSVNLQHFSGADLRLDQEQTRRVLKFFFPGTDIDHINITDDDRSFAQALLVEAIDASTSMSYVQIIFEKMYTPPTDFGFIKDLAKAFVKNALVNWFRHATGKDFKDPKIYMTVRNQLALNFRSVWVIRLQTGELTY